MREPSVVRVEVATIPNQISGSGSGFFVSDDGLLVTNFHVIRNVRYATVETDDGAVCRHHDADHLRDLLAEFDLVGERRLEVTTMNGHQAAAMQLLARKR